MGQKEYQLIQEAGKFPPRLPIRPIFYPVLNQGYAEKIARDWNTKDAASGYVGYVLKFAVMADFLEEFPVQVVGSSECQELWIPAERLDEFNEAIVRPIETVTIFRGE